MYNYDEILTINHIVLKKKKTIPILAIPIQKAKYSGLLNKIRPARDFGDNPMDKPQLAIWLASESISNRLELTP